jgi:hypothetical protein
MNKWTILSAVVLLGAVAVSIVEARGVSYGGCANGQCGLVSTTADAPAPAPAPAQPAVKAEAKPAPVSAPQAPASTPKAEKTSTDPAPEATSVQQGRTRLFSGRFLRFRRR